MYAKIFSSSLYGINAYIVEIEVQLERSLPFFGIVGLPDATVRESRERVKAALINSGITFPIKKITVNLAPADIKKEGAYFDLPIAMGILGSSGTLDFNQLEDTLFVGELSFEGILRPIKGALSIVIEARKRGFKKIVMPVENAKEAAILTGIKIYGFNDLRSVISFALSSNGEFKPVENKLPNLENIKYNIDYSDVNGQTYVKRGISIAVAGNHNILMVGPPGSGKTMIAKRINTIMPPMKVNEAIEITRIYSISGLLTKNKIMLTRPFRNPHHTASDVAIIGGGIIPKPGEVSLAHRGVLFLDELPEFKKNVLNTLRQPMEDGVVTIARAEQTLSFPANFMLVAAMNPCPCGYYGHPEIVCKCSEDKIKKYISRISGPILDRIDLQLEVPKVSFNEMANSKNNLSSSQMYDKIMTAKEKQTKRFNNLEIIFNSEMTRKMIETFCKISDSGKRILKTAMDKLGMSARGYDKILRISRTIADLDGDDEISDAHIMEAIQFRSLDRLIK